MSITASLRAFLRLRIFQLATLASLFALVLWRGLARKLALSDLDNWWHLKVGDWIVHNHAFPHTGLFSRTAADHPWAAYSWGYEILLSFAYRWFDIVGVGVFGIILTLLVAVSVYRMTRHLSGRFWPGCLIAAIACSVFLFTMCPRPVYFSMMLYAAELTLILEANRSGRTRPLYWLPLIFLFWANLHIQFVYGLAVLGLFFVVTAARSLLYPAQNAPAGRLAGSFLSRSAILAGAVIASLLNPYSYHLYEVVYQYAHGKVPSQMIRELQPFALLTPSHYLQMFLTAGAFIALAWKKQFDPFRAALLLLATVIGYRTMRDSWFICITAAACLADSTSQPEAPEKAETPYECAALAVLLLIAGIFFARATHFNRAGIDAAISQIFPVDVVNYLRRHPQPGPLYNSLDWGGFLIWYMPDYPVAIDGRTDLYGDEILSRFFTTGGGDQSYLTDRYLNEAGVALLERQMPLVQVLQADPRFQKVYEDRLAVVFAKTRN